MRSRATVSKGGRERQRFQSVNSFWKWLQLPSFSQADTWSPDRQPGFPHGWQASKSFSHQLLPSKSTSRELHWKESRQTLNWLSDVWCWPCKDGGWTCCTKVPSMLNVLYQIDKIPFFLVVFGHEWLQFFVPINMLCFSFLILLLCWVLLINSIYPLVQNLVFSCFFTVCDCRFC